MAGQEFQYIDDIMKDFFAPAIVNQVYKKAPFWAQIEKKETGVFGKSVQIPIQTAFTESVGSRVRNNYNLPTAGRNVYDRASLTMKRLYGRIKVDGFAIESSAGKGGWVDIVAAETKGVSNAFAIECDRQSMCRGTGVLGTYVSGTTAVTVDAPAGIAGDTPVAKWFRVGQVIDVWAVATGNAAVVSDSTITAISSTGVLTMDTLYGASDGDYLCRQDSMLANGINTGAAFGSIGDMYGIDIIIDTVDPAATAYGDFEGIDRATYDIWQAYKNTTSRVISETAIQEDLDAIDHRTDGEAPNLMLMTTTLRNKLVDIIRADRTVQTLDLKAGYKGIKFSAGEKGEIPIMVHKNCPVGYVYYISLPHIKFYSLKKLVWDNKGGGIIKPVAGEDAYEAWFKMYANIGTDCCNAHGKATAFTTS
jgi:hypothetical protein